MIDFTADTYDVKGGNTIGELKKENTPNENNLKYNNIYKMI